MNFPNFYFKRRKRPSYLKAKLLSGANGAKVNLFDKSKSPGEGIKNETAVETWAGTAYKNEDLISVLKPNKKYLMSYDYECIDVPDNATLNSNQMGFIFYSGVNSEIYPAITATKELALKIGDKGHFEKVITIPERFNDSVANYNMLCYTNRYLDESDNAYYSKVIFRNIRIVEV